MRQVTNITEEQNGHSDPTHHRPAALPTTFGISFVTQATISSWVVRWSGMSTRTLG
jgi:hypothetical protein